MCPNDGYPLRPAGDVCQGCYESAIDEVAQQIWRERSGLEDEMESEDGGCAMSVSGTCLSCDQGYHADCDGRTRCRCICNDAPTPDNVEALMGDERA